MSNFLDNIKLIASELANMSPKTQLEIVKLCKNLCLNVKDYLVELDETTLVNITTQLDNLEDELTTAEGNIQANANAIETINDTIDLINIALNNRYTKEEIDLLLNSKVDTSKIGYFELNSTSGTLTDAQYNEIIKDYCIIKVNSKYYYKDEITTTNIYFKSYVTISNITSAKRVYYQILNVTISNKNYNNTIIELEVYNTQQTDALLNNKQNTLVSGTNIKTINSGTILGSGNIDLQPPLISGTNIKTINNESILGGGNIDIQGGGGATLYRHKICFNFDNGSVELNIYVNVITSRATSYTSYTQFKNDINYAHTGDYGLMDTPIFAIVEDALTFEQFLGNLYLSQIYYLGYDNQNNLGYIQEVARNDTDFTVSSDYVDIV